MYRFELWITAALCKMHVKVDIWYRHTKYTSTHFMHYHLYSLYGISRTAAKISNLPTFIIWWRHEMVTFAVLLAFSEVNPPDNSGLSSQRASNYEVWVSLLVSCTSCWRRNRWDHDVHVMLMWWMIVPLIRGLGPTLGTNPGDWPVPPHQTPMKD